MCYLRRPALGQALPVSREHSPPYGHWAPPRTVVGAAGVAPDARVAPDACVLTGCVRIQAP